MNETIAISGEVFTLMQTECIRAIRQEFDEANHWTVQGAIIEKAKEMQLPGEFIMELRADQDQPEEGSILSLMNGLKALTDEIL